MTEDAQHFKLRDPGLCHLVSLCPHPTRTQFPKSLIAPQGRGGEGRGRAHGRGCQFPKFSSNPIVEYLLYFAPRAA